VFTDTLGWRWAFVFMTLLFGVVGLLLWRDGRRQRAEQALAAPAAQPTAPPPQPAYGRQALEIITGRWSRVVLIVALIEGASGFGVLAIWASHLHHELGLSLSAAGAVVALFGLGGMAYMAVARWLIPRLGEHGLARTGVTLLGLSSLVIAFTPLWWPSLPASLVAGFGFFMFHNTMQTNATQMAPHARGTAVSLFASFLFMGQSIGVLLAAALVGVLGSTAVIALGSAVLVAVGVYFSLALRRRTVLMQGAS
ncbi:MAG: MFS transporter, partial [Burkholderiaceae bacterium]|nr:MFS transporter [Burkholderiaceae bacterium]